ncbi:hypothetical protein KDA14_06160 [Candidatus Saccharibacteria bacterium]|nr:hypothetical protein [Candidatus Saccharibacteria bacterium]
MMTRQDRYEANVGLMDEGGELDECEAFHLLDEEVDWEREWPVVAKIWRGLDLVFLESVPESGEGLDNEV